MRSRMNGSKRSMAIAVMVGFLVMALGAPAFAGAGATQTKSAANASLKNDSIAPPTFIQPPPKSKGNTKPGFLLRHLRDIVNGVTATVDSLVNTIQSSSETTVGIIDGPDPY